MIITPNSQFTVTVIRDTIHGYKTGTLFHPKGVYWHKDNMILVGDKDRNYTTRLALPAIDVIVEVTE